MRPAHPELVALAGHLDAVARANLVREFPYAPAHVVRGPDDLALPRDQHPAFYGCFDWHSAVHMHWLLVRLLRSYPQQVDAPAVRRLLDAHLAPEPMQVEAAYLRDDPGFERPYGWAWLLTLAAECADWAGDASADEQAGGWADALEPAVEVLSALVLDWLPRAVHPVRDGSHANSAFALALMLDAATALDRPQLAAALREAATGWFAADRDVPAAWEPSGEDFLSPALVEADLVRRLLTSREYADWLTAFLPGLADGRPRTLLEPVDPPDRSDGRIGHLDGLNFSRAAALGAIQAALPDDDPRRPLLRASAQRHRQAALPALTSEEYMSSHWLAIFAVLAFDHT